MIVDKKESLCSDGIMLSPSELRKDMPNKDAIEAPMNQMERMKKIEEAFDTLDQRMMDIEHGIEQAIEL